MSAVCRALCKVPRKAVWCETVPLWWAHWESRDGRLVRGCGWHCMVMDLAEKVEG